MAPEGFVFTVKAFQGITHPASSPTWRRSNVRPTPGHGLLRPTKEVLDSWAITFEVCSTLRAKVCVIQTPASLMDTQENIRNADEFFGRIERDDLMIGFEPRGWSPENVRKICEKWGLIHVVDPFASKPEWTLEGRVAYFRLHGSPPGKKMYNYTYTDSDLAMLAEVVNSIEAESVYVMFNNVTMMSDALRFKDLLSRML